MAEELQAKQKPDSVLIALRHGLRTTDGSKPRRKQAKKVRLGPTNRKQKSGKYAEKLIG
jgi:hypothetical protein